MYKPEKSNTMRKWLTLLLLTTFVGICWQCGSDSNKGDQDNKGQTKQTDTATGKSKRPGETLKTKGQKIVKASGKALVGQLTKAMGSGGVGHAIEFCSQNAVSITDSLSQVHGVNIGRISHKNRNPENAADSLEMTLIKNYQEKNEKDKKLTPKIVERNGRKYYYHPIKINNPLCLNCHGQKGKNIKTEDYITIQNFYPNDKATGFSMGDLRGMWKVEFEETAM